MHRATSVWLTALLVSFAACSDSSGPDGDNDPNDCDHVIGAPGGTVSCGTARIQFPAASLTRNTEITISPVATPADLVAEGAIGQAFRIDPVAQTLAVPARVSIDVPAAALGGRPMSAVTIRRSTTVNAALTPAGELLTDIQRQGNTVSGLTTRLGVFSAAIPPNQNPTANAGTDQTVTAGGTVNLTGTGSDPDGGTLGFQWTFVSRPAGSNATITNANAANASFVADVAGAFELRLTVSDNQGGTATDTVVITATPASARAPNDNAGPDQSVGVGVTVNLIGAASSDPQGGALIFAWTFVSRPAGSNATLVNATTATPTFVTDVAGVYEVQLIVIDNEGLSDRDSVRVTATQQNRAPTLQVTAPDVVLVGAQIDVVASATDPDGNAVTLNFELIERPAGSGAGLTELGDRARFTGDVPGVYRVRVTASDGSLSTQQEVQILVNPSVAGNYAVAVFADARSCGQSATTVNGTLPVLQPSPGQVILDLPGASSRFVTQVNGTLSGENFTFNGPVTIDTGGDPDTDDRFVFNGGINGTIGANGQMNLAFSFNAPAGFCTIPGTIIGNRTP